MSQPLVIRMFHKGERVPCVYYERWGDYTDSAFWYCMRFLKCWKAMEGHWGDVEKLLGKKLPIHERVGITHCIYGARVCEDDEGAAPITALMSSPHATEGIFTLTEGTSVIYENGGCGWAEVDLDDFTTSVNCNAVDYEECFLESGRDYDPEITSHEWFDKLPVVDLDPNCVHMDELEDWWKVLQEYDYFRVKNNDHEVYEVMK